MGPASDSSRPRNETSKPLISAYEPRFGRISATPGQLGQEIWNTCQQSIGKDMG